MKVLAVGAAGESAGLVTRALSARGVSVRGLVRSREKEHDARANGATEIAVADLTNRDALANALRGIDAVFHIIPAFASDEAAAGTTLVDVAAAAGVRRIVFSSVYHPSLRDLSNHRDKQPAEQAIYDSGMEFTVLQPAMFMGQLRGVITAARDQGMIAGPYSADALMSYVDYRDVAEVAALAFTTDRFVNGTFELASPGMYTRRDLAGMLSDLLGRPVRAEGRFEPIPEGAGTSPAMRDGLNRMFEHYDRNGFHGGNSLVLATMLERDPMTVSAYLAELVRT